MDDNDDDREDLVEPRSKKRRRTEEAVETERMTAGRTTRSKKRKVRADEDMGEEDIVKPRLKRSKAASTSDDPGSVVPQPQPPTPEASADPAATITTCTPPHCHLRRSNRIRNPRETIAAEVAGSDPARQQRSLRPIQRIQDVSGRPEGLEVGYALLHGGAYLDSTKLAWRGNGPSTSLHDVTRRCDKIILATPSPCPTATYRNANQTSPTCRGSQNLLAATPASFIFRDLVVGTGWTGWDRTDRGGRVWHN